MQYLLLLYQLVLFPLINSNDSPFLSGFYTDGLDQIADKIEIVYPEKVSKDGSVSHNIPHFYDMESVDNRQRRRSGHTRDRKDEAIHFYVPIEGEKNYLELWPNSNFISPGLVIEHRDARDVSNINKAKISQISSKQCHYNGHIVGKPDSTVALSTCFGLTGYIRVPNGNEYLIEPVKDFRPEPNQEHPHIIYKRSGLKENHGESNCRTKGRAKESLEERMKWEALYGDQVRREQTGINMNELVRAKVQEKKEPEHIDPPFVEKSRYIDRNKILSDAQDNIGTIDSKTVQTKLDYNVQGEPQIEHFDKERNKKVDFGDRFNQKSLIEEKGFGDIKLSEEHFKSVNVIPAEKLDNSLLYDINNRLKGRGENYGHIVKRDLKVEDYEHIKLNNENKQNTNSDDNNGKFDCGKNSQPNDKKINEFENSRNIRSELFSNNSVKDETLTDEHVNFHKQNINKREPKQNEQQQQSQNDQVLPKDGDSHYKCDPATITISRKESISNGMIDSPLDPAKDNKKRDVHLDASDKSWQTNKDISNLNSKQDKLYDKNSQEDASNMFPSEQSSSIENIDSISKSDPFGQMEQKSFDTNEEIPYSGETSRKHKAKKEINENLSIAEFRDKPQIKTNSNPTINKGGSSLFENEHIINNAGIANDKSQIPILSDINKKVIQVNKVADSNLASAVSSEAEKQPEKDNPGRAEDIVIRINIQEGPDIKSGINVISDSNNNEQNGNFGINHAESRKTNDDKNTLAMDSEFNGNMDKKIAIAKEAIKDMKRFESQNLESINFGGEENKISQNKIKRQDNTIHLKIETEPEFRNADGNVNSKTGLFCQGNNCLEIKPIHLNQSNSVSPSVNNNTNTNNTVTKAVQKRQVDWEGDCNVKTTTQEPLICFDFFSKLFNLELMIVVDHKVLKMHDDDDLEHFILTIINMVSTNFNDRSLGINLSVVLVRLIVLSTCIKELDSDRFNPEELLENFCTWQVLINPGKDDHPHHHDLAIFVTRLDKCEGKLMGVTYMTSVCRPDKACLVCVDEGLLLANTITHQIGHSLGADHDDSSSGCSSSSNAGVTFHMAPTISETNSAWSPCSKDSIIQFVRTQGSWCLTDLPIDRNFHFPLMLPGQIYSAAQQCKLNFHMTSIPCSVGSFCEKLYCQVTDKLCATKGDPPADGTFCAGDMWCFHKQCVHVGRRPGSVNGEWGPWTEWSICTRSCGGGVSTSYRICNNPKPENGGRFCIGDRIRHRMCATKPCQGFTESFRDLQCKRTEDRPFKGRFHNWLQYTSHFLNIECALVCQNRKGDVVMRSPVVADGTPCKAGTRNVCIQGACRNVGCDWIIDSKAKEDACGICHGNSTECRIIQGVFDEPCIKKGLVEFLRIPKNSGMIFVREINPSRNIIVVSGAINKVFYLNGMGSEDSMPGDVTFGGSHGVYEVRSDMERVFIRGPIKEELIFYVLFREQNTGVHFQYAVPEIDPTYVPRYLWQYIDWDPCTDPCSGGAQRAHAKCVEDRGGVVDDQYCTETTRPHDIIRPCNDFPCAAKWWVSVWSDCICTGSSSVMFRSVLCMRATDESGTRSEVVKESECAAFVKPPTQKPCNASEFENDCVKRSIYKFDDLSSHKYHRRAVNPKIAYSYSSDDESNDLDNEITEGKQKSSSNKSQKKPVKLQSAKFDNLKDETIGLKSKLTNKESSNLDKNNVKLVKDKNSEASLMNYNKEVKYNVKDEDLPIGPEKGKQLAKFTMKNGPSLRGSSNSMKHVGKAKQADEPSVDIPSQDVEVAGDKCKSTTPYSGTCPTQEDDTSESSTCKETNPVVPHKKTTCCKTSPRRKLTTRTMETTTLRPVFVKKDELDMHTFAITLVPLDMPSKKKLPQSDPEFINLGNIGMFGVGDENNATILTGQEAVDFLEYARNNASEEPVILHEDMHN